MERKFGEDTLKAKTVASWITNLGFLGCSIAHTRRMMTRRMKLKIRRAAQPFRQRFLHLPLWWLHVFSDIAAAAVVAVAVAVNGGGEFLFFFFVGVGKL